MNAHWEYKRVFAEARARGGWKISGEVYSHPLDRVNELAADGWELAFIHDHERADALNRTTAWKVEYIVRRAVESS